MMRRCLMLFLFIRFRHQTTSKSPFSIQREKVIERETESVAARVFTLSSLADGGGTNFAAFTMLLVSRWWMVAPPPLSDGGGPESAAFAMLPGDRWWRFHMRVPVVYRRWF
ncbi:hypothetical protein Hanom_Chr11g01033371 [Helianthus anomalus]